MKKIIVLALGVVIFLGTNAQTKFGVKAGANIPDLSGDDVSDDIKNKVGFYVGGFVAITVSETFSVQPELLWSNKGYKYEELGGDITTTFNYINIPVLIQYHAKGFYAETGPQIGILINAKSKGSLMPVADVKDSFKSTAFSWGLGVGYQLPSGFGLGVRYNLGFGSISEESNIDAKFNVLMLGVSYSFGGKKK
jgi:hypothetical protein